MNKDHWPLRTSGHPVWGSPRGSSCSSWGTSLLLGSQRCLMGRCGRSWGTFSCLPELGLLLQMTAGRTKQRKVWWALSRAIKYSSHRWSCNRQSDWCWRHLNCWYCCTVRCRVIEPHAADDRSQVSPCCGHWPLSFQGWNHGSMAVTIMHTHTHSHTHSKSKDVNKSTLSNDFKCQQKGPFKV